MRVLLALTISAIVAAFTVPLYTDADGKALHDECAEEIVRALEQTRQAARARKTTAGFYLDADAESYSAAGETNALRLPDEASVTITPARPIDAASAPNAIVFFSDGSSSGGEIRIVYRHLVHVIAVDGSTGQVSLR